jgi:hypothetical protein
MERKNSWMVWTGPLFAILFAIDIAVLAGDTPGEKASATEVMDYFNSHQGRVLTDAFLSPLMALLLVLFASHIRTMVRDRHLVPGQGPTVLLAGAVLWVGGGLLGTSLSLAVETASDHGQAQIAQTINVLSNDAWLPFVAGIAVTMVGAGLTVLGTGLLPKWLGWVALVVGVVSLAGPGGFIGFFVAPVWILVAGVMLARAPAPSLPEEPAVTSSKMASA